MPFLGRIGSAAKLPQRRHGALKFKTVPVSGGLLCTGTIIRRAGAATSPSLNHGSLGIPHIVIPPLQPATLEKALLSIFRRSCRSTTLHMLSSWTSCQAVVCGPCSCRQDLLGHALLFRKRGVMSSCLLLKALSYVHGLVN
jgi:hypothetical protein